jgi:hypothetical protein
MLVFLVFPFNREIAALSQSRKLAMTTQLKKSKKQKNNVIAIPALWLREAPKPIAFS